MHAAVHTQQVYQPPVGGMLVCVLRYLQHCSAEGIITGAADLGPGVHQELGLS